MSIDGFREFQTQPFVAFSPTVARRFFSLVDRLSRRLNVEIVGLDNVPKGAALLVGNHTFGWDSIFPMSALWQRGRRVWVLGEHAWWRFPFLRRLAAAVGTVDGTMANVDRLLSQDELVLVLPGGLREALKPRELRYRLLWGRRYASCAQRSPIKSQSCPWQPSEGTRSSSCSATHTRGGAAGCGETVSRFLCPRRCSRCHARCDCGSCWASPSRPLQQRRRTTKA